MILIQITEVKTRGVLGFFVGTLKLKYLGMKV